MGDFFLESFETDFEGFFFLNTFHLLKCFPYIFKSSKIQKIFINTCKNKNKTVYDGLIRLEIQIN